MVITLSLILGDNRIRRGSNMEMNIYIYLPSSVSHLLLKISIFNRAFVLKKKYRLFIRTIVCVTLSIGNYLSFVGDYLFERLILSIGNYLSFSCEKTEYIYAIKADSEEVSVSRFAKLKHYVTL
ncbi:hypothetical protein DBV15_05077 [Temnothorax longispinosus]|uniref:Uncharacterized protein n=1 Tax=Temnothorax longispinosus TaxID=300112 RepID=A0A4S2KY91_9HYME|nr:hypothetical protein DBV15_05077 [Temnothorax longispinosus]